MASPEEEVNDENAMTRHVFSFPDSRAVIGRSLPCWFILKLGWKTLNVNKRREIQERTKVTKASQNGI